MANNRIVANGGTNLAGALGIFSGTDNYNVTGNDFCGNFSAEYGGAISHYGFSNNGTITRNRIYYNQGYDEGGGIFIAGALPANNSQLSPGAGAVTIDGNTLISNQSNDDGGGIRFLDGRHRQPSWSRTTSSPTTCPPTKVAVLPSMTPRT